MEYSGMLDSCIVLCRCEAMLSTCPELSFLTTCKDSMFELCVAFL